MAKTKSTCPECGGPKFGRGYSHRGNCSLAFKAKAPKSGARKGRRKARGQRSFNGSTISVESIGRMPIETVIELRRAVDEALRSRHSEVQRMIRTLELSIR
ncbi:MAG TPA: hypothetical protein VNT79_15460 [Phycisphaerae bacterium]|nr:hypothetical protein [Phycisphaerae bacterium]